MKALLVLAAAAPLWAQCSYSIDATQFNIQPGSGTGSVTGTTIHVTATSGCSWGATTNTPWLHIDFGQTGTGPGTVGWHADTNTFPASRSGSLSVAGQSIPVVQAAQACTYTLTPSTPPDYPASGGSGNFQVQTSCTWQPTQWPGWAAPAPDSTGAVTGNGKVNYTVASNPCVTGRSGSFTISSGTQFTITQDGSPNNFSFNPASESYAATAMDDRIFITTGGGCPWNVYSDVSWLTVTAQANGNGNGSFTIHLLANNSVTRTGNIHINNGATIMLLPVTQAAPAPPTPVLSKVANAADYSADAVSPGEIVSLFGSNIGPIPASGLQVNPDGVSIAKNLAGVQVMFDKVQAALTYVSAGQVNAVVPYGLAGNPQTVIQVINQGTASNSITMPIQAATPAIFTLDASGLGQGAILNQNLTVNAASNRAARGSVVVIYLTGAGVTDPPSADASITGTPLPQLTLPYSVTIGGQTATVQYAGGAPATVAGLTQINVVVPSGIAPGNLVPVVVTVGGVSSPNGVTLAVQ